MTPPQFAVSGAPRAILRGEGLCLLVASFWLLTIEHGSWLMVAALFLAPDLGMMGYLVNPRFGAASYNALHTSLLYGPVIGFGVLLHSDLAVQIGLIGLAHVGFDRLVGYGLKYPDRSMWTHLGSVGNGVRV